ncbi:MAG TPA: GNAT family N-acetyltransferase [Chloroflexota bacterium]|nr:GNAT family N-acetyltransferase [Chloroflexota bacterium]
MDPARAVIRDARPSDLSRVYEIAYENATRDDPAPPPNPGFFADIQHEFHAGRMVVAERAGMVWGYASSVARGRIVFLSSLFIAPSRQSSGLGRALLEALRPPAPLVFCTDSSSDPRAVALYIQAGMRPRWPLFYLRGPAVQRDLASPALETRVADAGDPELARWDAEISGRARPMDHAFWIAEERAIPLWFSRGGSPVGYGYVRLGAGTLHESGAAVLGPIGARTASDARACVLAAVHWAAQRAPTLRIDVLGPHPVLEPLLAAGFLIIDQDIFMAGRGRLGFDPRRYIPSGGSLF